LINQKLQVSGNIIWTRHLLKQQTISMLHSPFHIHHGL
jgi:hypothetical protein